MIELEGLRNAILRGYETGKDDYWMAPLVAQGDDGKVKGRIDDGDCVVFACRRGEREIQLTEAFVAEDFPHFERKMWPRIDFFPMVQYDQQFEHVPPLFPTEKVTLPLAEVLANHGKTQFHLAESEKFAHVTYFFNGRRKAPYPGEIQCAVPSVTAKFELHPEMRTLEIAQKLVESMQSIRFDFGIVNIAAGDIIGHSPDWNANVRCVEVIDQAIGQITHGALEKGYTLIVTADHGVLETGIDSNGQPSVRHTPVPVPCLLIAKGLEGKTGVLRGGGTLGDVAPTILSLLGIKQPPEMTGRSLLQCDICAERVLLLVVDGWGEGENNPARNPIVAAQTRNYDSLREKFPVTLLSASGQAVGLHPASSGNSESGHISLGAGRIIPQDEVRISQALTEGTLKNHPEFSAAIARVVNRVKSCHVLLLLSPQSSHGSMGEGVRIIETAAELGVQNVYVHCILDGRSAPPYAAPQFLAELERELAPFPAQVVTAIGRGYCLSRSNDYQKTTRIAYEALVQGKGTKW